MSFSPGLLVFISLCYMGLLFAVAYATDHGWIPQRLARHPLVHTLSLGVYVSAWGLYGVVEFAAESGLHFLTFYLGLSGAFLLAPMFLQPLLQLARTHQLHSLPDLLAFRFRSQAFGTLATLVTLIGVMPLMTAQIQTISQVVHALAGQPPHWGGPVFCCLLISFTLLFGARRDSGRHGSHAGLVTAIALESLVKLIALAAVGLYACFAVFDGPIGLNHWLHDNALALDSFYTPLHDGYWHSLLLMFFLSAVVMPCMYQMTFTENRDPRQLLTASWGMPLYLLLMALGIPVILWAGMALNLDIDPELFTLGIALQAQSPALVLLLFVGSLAAASGILIVTTLALANMMLNHVLLPLRGWRPDDALYSRTLRQRRLLIVFILLAAWILAAVPDLHPDSTAMSMLAFVAVLQLAPGLLALLFWPRATATGAFTGLAAGMTIWLTTLLLPALFLPELGRGYWLDSSLASRRIDSWHAMGLAAILVNMGLMVLVSLLGRQSQSDLDVAESCSVDSLRSTARWRLATRHVEDFVLALTPALGPITAEREVAMACHDLGLNAEETRPYALRRLREQLASNLSGLLGPNMAQDILDSHLPQIVASEQRSEDIHYLESHLEEYRDRLSGLAAELDLLRRFHRQTLHDLPLGVCTLATDREIMSWNQAMMDITGCADERVIGSRLENLPAPWNQVLDNFLDQPGAQQPRIAVEVDGQTHWLNLHRAVIGDVGDSLVLVMEDVTALQQLEARLQHAERLAAIGRLAAGVAHEIGNPVTGIASLAQNLRAERKQDADLVETASDILEQTQRVTRIVQSLVGFARSGQQVQQAFDGVPLLPVVDEAIHLLKLSPEARGQRYELHIDSELQVCGDAQRLCQVFINLLSNARDASTREGRVIVRARRNGERVHVEIEDFGHGLPDGALREQLLEPFVTTKPAGKGTGLGLALVHGIIAAHQGRIQLVDKRDYDQGHGVIVQLTLPAWRARRNHSAEESSA